ncbi:MAG: DNA polymerase I [Desulfobacteraceae bacterium]|nr:DNA polymerase I [Desulfobacteraceae bacterium]
MTSDQSSTNPTLPLSKDRPREKTIYLVDGSAYIHRAYHAIRGLSNSRGMPTNALFGFTRMLIKLMEERNPAFVGMFFDAKGPTFRHDLYEAYKANRPPMPEDLRVQIAPIKEVTAGFHIPVIEEEGFEADDLIGTLARTAQSQGYFVIMVTGDKDFMQLVTPHAVIWDPMKEISIDEPEVRNRFGVEPRQVIDIMALAGDSSDNVPGVPGIGPKTASKLIQTFGSLDALYDRLEEVGAKKQRENLDRHRDQAFLSRRLVTIRTDAPMAFRPADLARAEPDRQRLGALFAEYEFRQLQQTFSETTAQQKTDYRLVTRLEEISELASRLGAAPRFALDTETTSENPNAAELVGISFSDRAGRAWYIPVGHHVAEEQSDREQALQVLRPLLEDPAVAKVGQNIKYDWIVLDRHGVNLQGVTFDTMLGSYLLNPSKRSHGLDQIALDFLGRKTISFEEVAGKDGKAVGFRNVPLDKAVPYACEDADVTLAACEVLEPMLEEAGLTELMQTVEMPLVPVLMRMEMRGVCVDTDRLRELSASFQERMTVLEERIYEMAGERFNVKSSQQLGHILFDKLGLPVQKKTKKKTGYSTDMDVLTTLAERHELPALVLQHRTLAKLKSTYADALLDLVRPETDRIHTSFNQTVTATGRLSSSEPNLQNIPIRTEEGREIRKAFVPEPGWSLLSADYSQIELRILAHCAEDTILIKAFEEGEDIHTRTAAEIFQVFPEMVDDELRRQAKVINFGIIYGMSPFGLSKALGISQKMAKTYIDHYFERYSGVKRFIDETIRTARATHRCATLLGRIRRLPEINSGNRNVRQFAERTAVNTPVQGTAADLIKLAMIRVDERLRGQGLETAMLLSVHDEIVFESPPGERDTVERLVRDAMENVWQLRVPLKVNLAWGENWALAH